MKFVNGVRMVETGGVHRRPKEFFSRHRNVFIAKILLHCAE